MGYYFGAWVIGSALGNWLCERNRSGRTQKRVLGCFLCIEGVAIYYLSTLQIPEPGLVAFLFIGLTCGYSDNLIITTLQSTTPSSLRTCTSATAMAICHGSSPLSTGLAGLWATMLGRRIDWIYSGCGVMIHGLVGYLFFLGKNFDRLGQRGFELSETCCPQSTMVENRQPKPDNERESENKIFTLYDIVGLIPFNVQSAFHFCQNKYAARPRRITANIFLKLPVETWSMRRAPIWAPKTPPAPRRRPAR